MVQGKERSGLMSDTRQPWKGMLLFDNRGTSLSLRAVCEVKHLSLGGRRIVVRDFCEYTLSIQGSTFFCTV